MILYVCVYIRDIGEFHFIHFVPILKMIELFKVVSFEGIFHSIRLISSGRKKNFHSLENSLDLCFLDVGKERSRIFSMIVLIWLFIF